MKDKCKKCKYRWFGNHEHKTFAQWYCRIGNIKVGIDKAKCPEPSDKSNIGRSKNESKHN